MHHLTSDEELIKNSSLVITIAGTSSMSATFFGKPSIVFSETIFSPFLSSVKKIESLEELPDDIYSSLKTHVDISELNNYVEIIKENSFEFDYFDLYLKINKEFYRDGYLKDIEIQPEKMASFLEQNQLLFEKLADQHILKINEYKKSKI